MRKRPRLLFNFTARWLVVLWGLSTLAGCAGKPAPVFVLSEESKKLAPAHQKQMEQSLARLFGTPLNPRWAVPDEESDSETPELRPVYDSDRLELGAAVYQERCAGCHGDAGAGDGPAAAYLFPKPRDYRRGIFKFTSTPYGAKPLRSDLARVVRYGAKGTSMPDFRWLSDEEIEAVVDYVITLAHRGEVEMAVAQVVEIDYEEEDPIEELEFLDALARIHGQWESAQQQAAFPITPRPAYDEQSIAAGRQAFVTRGCSKCHGEDGRGQTEWLDPAFVAKLESSASEGEAQINRDAWGEVAPAADLTAGMLHGGRRPIDVYRRIYTGINGTPMPAFADALADAPEDFWHLTHYVLSVVEGRAAPFETSPATAAAAAAAESAEE